MNKEALTRLTHNGVRPIRNLVGAAYFDRYGRHMPSGALADTLRKLEDVSDSTPVPDFVNAFLQKAESCNERR